jgi:hypothetical protein
LFFLCFASSQNFASFRNVPTSQGKKQALKNKTDLALCMDVKQNQNLIYFIYQQKIYSTKSKNRKKTTSLICFAAVLVENICARRRKTKKNRKMKPQTLGHSVTASVNQRLKFCSLLPNAVMSPLTRGVSPCIQDFFLMCCVFLSCPQNNSVRRTLKKLGMAESW